MRQSIEQFVLEIIRSDNHGDAVGFRRIWSMVLAGAGRDESIPEVIEVVTQLILDGYVVEVYPGLYERTATVADTLEGRTLAEVQCGHALPMSQCYREVK